MLGPRRKPYAFGVGEGTRMANDSIDEIRKAVARCIDTGHVLRVAEQSERIAHFTGEDQAVTARALLEAGIMARVNMAFGLISPKG